MPVTAPSTQRTAFSPSVMMLRMSRLAPFGIWTGLSMTVLPPMKQSSLMEMAPTLPFSSSVRISSGPAVTASAKRLSKSGRASASGVCAGAVPAAVGRAEGSVTSSPPRGMSASARMSSAAAAAARPG